MLIRVDPLSMLVLLTAPDALPVDFADLKLYPRSSALIRVETLLLFARAMLNPAHVGCLLLQGRTTNLH
ncbi:MAG TPA: hypothetical protein VFJ87_00450 [Rhodanobacteraceae bacterium]|nr:hypothetical protein [Rhodanobacteraceae bacterium]